jgi:hypothetical protein
LGTIASSTIWRDRHGYLLPVYDRWKVRRAFEARSVLSSNQTSAGRTLTVLSPSIRLHLELAFTLSIR